MVQYGFLINLKDKESDNDSAVGQIAEGNAVQKNNGFFKECFLGYFGCNNIKEDNLQVLISVRAKCELKYLRRIWPYFLHNSKTKPYNTYWTIP